MIPKTIHYCWFGRGEKPKLAKRCIESWKKFCPDYEIIEWNEDNFDVQSNPYTARTHENRQFAFLSDYVRLKIVEENGGFYFDTDVELLKPPDELREYKAFFGFETEAYVNTGMGFGAEAHQPVVQEMIKTYEPLLQKDATEVIGCPILNTQALLACGLQQNGLRQTVAEAEVFPIAYFNPYDDPTGRLNITNDTYSIHWYAKTWMCKGKVLRSKLTKPVHRLFGVNFLHRGGDKS